MKKLRISAVVLSLVTGMAVQAETLQIDGSTTVGPIADAFAEYFKKVYADLDITVKKTGSGDGAAALVDGRCDIATMSRFMKDKEFKDAVANNVLPVAHVVAGSLVTANSTRDGTSPSSMTAVAIATLLVSFAYNGLGAVREAAAGLG